jgi:DNA-binding transcriptional MerR regulator
VDVPVDGAEPTEAFEQRERSRGLLTTGDMARLTGNTLRTVRFYEEAGILCPDRRSVGGHRLFGHRELERLQFISDMRTAGLSLDEIRALLELKVGADSGKQAAEAALEALDEKIEVIERKMAVFARLSAELQQTRAILRGCQECTNRRCFPDACDECEVMSDQPDLPLAMRVLWSVDGAEKAD